MAPPLDDEPDPEALEPVLELELLPELDPEELEPDVPVPEEDDDELELSFFESLEVEVEAAESFGFSALTSPERESVR